MEMCIHRRNFTETLAIVTKLACKVQNFVIRQLLPHYILYIIYYTKVFKAIKTLGAAVLSSSRKVGQMRRVIFRRGEYRGRNSQVKTKTEVISKRTKSFVCLFVCSLLQERKTEQVKERLKVLLCAV